MTQPQLILFALSQIGGKGTCGQIAAEIRLSRVDVEKRISKLVRAGKVRIIDPKGSYTVKGNRANIYCVVNESEPTVTATTLFNQKNTEQ